jgi:hypothetical protein
VELWVVHQREKVVVQLVEDESSYGDDVKVDDEEEEEEEEEEEDEEEYAEVVDPFFEIPSRMMVLEEVALSRHNREEAGLAAAMDHGNVERWVNLVDEEFAEMDHFERQVVRQ